MDWTHRRVLVTGGRGFLGARISRRLLQLGARVTAVGRAEADLRDASQAAQLVARVRPQVVVHCAASGGGIGWMRAHPVESGRDNVLINVHTLDAACQGGAELFVGISSACAYPRDCPVPFREEQLWEGFPEPTNAAYALSKRVMMELGRACHDQHGLQVAFPVLANLYGPGDSTSHERAHVVADLIMRSLQAPPALQVWGSGRATRELIYIDDAVEGVLAAAASPAPGPVNIGTGQEVSIAALAREIVRATAFAGELRFDPSLPDGQPRKCMDVSLARTRLGFSAGTPLAEGLDRTVAWYRERA